MVNVGIVGLKNKNMRYTTISYIHDAVKRKESRDVSFVRLVALLRSLDGNSFLNLQKMDGSGYPLSRFLPIADCTVFLHIISTDQELRTFLLECWTIGTLEI